MSSQLETAFHDAMLDVYRRAKAEAHYTATRFLGMVVERGGLETARYLLHAATVSEGYTALWERGRLDLTVEAVILQPVWRELFTDAERQILLAEYRKSDKGFAKLQADLATAQQPAGEDTRVKELTAQLAAAQQPLPVDAKLQQMRRDVALSEEQLKNKRLTVAQDVVWALINNPAFLYNH